MQAVQVEHYVQRAADFFKAMLLMRDEVSFRNSSALLAIHSAVSDSDALRVGLGEDKLVSDDHNKAADALRQALPPQYADDNAGLVHLKYLLANKSRVAYGSQRLNTKEFEMLFTKAERFAIWANRVGAKLKIEGWNHDNQ
jgi:hypothetical protein